VIKEIREEQGLRSRYIFTYKRFNIQHVNRAFKAAVKRAGIEDFKFHDPRHTFASHLTMKGASPKDLQELFGYKTISMTTRYAHLSQEHKKKAVNLLKGLTVPQPPANDTWHKTVTSLESEVSPTG